METRFEIGCSFELGGDVYRLLVDGVATLVRIHTNLEKCRPLLRRLVLQKCRKTEDGAYESLMKSPLRGETLEGLLHPKAEKADPDPPKAPRVPQPPQRQRRRRGKKKKKKKRPKLVRRKTAGGASPTELCGEFAVWRGTKRVRLVPGPPALCCEAEGFDRAARLFLRTDLRREHRLFAAFCRELFRRAEEEESREARRREERRVVLNLDPAELEYVRSWNVSRLIETAYGFQPGAPGHVYHWNRLHFEAAQLSRRGGCMRIPCLCRCRACVSEMIHFTALGKLPVEPDDLVVVLRGEHFFYNTKAMSQLQEQPRPRFSLCH